MKLRKRTGTGALLQCTCFDFKSCQETDIQSEQNSRSKPAGTGGFGMKRSRWIYSALIFSVAVCMAGCGQNRQTAVETTKESEAADQAGTARPAEQAETQAQPETQLQNASAVKPKETETEPESETQKLITSVEYTSKDGTVKITLPDNTWKVTQDADEMRVFSSGSDAMINIVHASTESAMKTLSIQKTKEELEAALTKQYSDANAYEIQSFEVKKADDVDIYRYVVKYNATARMWAYSVTYGIVAPDQAYVITGTVTEDNSALLKAVEDSVDSFTVLKDEKLKNVTALTTVAGTPDTGETSASAANTGSTQENGSLASYGTNSTLYASDTVNVRSGPGTDTDVIGGFSAGDPVTVTGETNGWYQISANGQTGYIRKDLLSTTQTAQTDQTNSNTNTTDQSGTGSADAVAHGESATATNYGSAVTMYTSDGVNVRTQPSTGSDVSATLGGGTPVTVIGETDNWFVVSTGSGTGYISKSLLSNSAPAGGGTTYDQSQASGTDTQTYQENQGNSGSSDGSSGGGNSAYVSGVVTSATGDTITISGDDGNTYTVNTSGADISTSEGLYSGLYVNVGYSTNGDGSLNASSVTG